MVSSQYAPLPRALHHSWCRTVGLPGNQSRLPNLAEQRRFRPVQQRQQHIHKTLRHPRYRLLERSQRRSSLTNLVV
jgi:hypothetical protein